MLARFACTVREREREREREIMIRRLSYIQTALLTDVFFISHAIPVTFEAQGPLGYSEVQAELRLMSFADMII